MRWERDEIGDKMGDETGNEIRDKIGNEVRIKVKIKDEGQEKRQGGRHA